MHKTVFPETGLEWSGVLVYGLIMALCNVAGIGGGGITQPLIMAFYKFPTKEAIAISSFTIVCSSAFRFFYQIR